MTPAAPVWFLTAQPLLSSQFPIQTSLCCPLVLEPSPLSFSHFALSPILAWCRSKNWSKICNFICACCQIQSNTLFMLVSAAGLMKVVRVSWLKIYFFESVRVSIFSFGLSLFLLWVRADTGRHEPTQLLWNAYKQYHYKGKVTTTSTIMTTTTTSTGTFT